MEWLTVDRTISEKTAEARSIETSWQEYSRVKPASAVVTGFKRRCIDIWAKMTILTIALNCYGSFFKALKATQGLIAFKKSVNGSNRIRKCIRANGKYYFGLYAAGFPSKAFNRFIQTELNRVIPHGKKVNRLELLHLAITNKCPLKCEHCFEWNNLNKPDVFTTDELRKLIRLFQKEGCSQIHFTGGEPLVRMAVLESLLNNARDESDCWVLSSGHNLTRENAWRIKRSGATGVVISLDHFDAEAHNNFRGFSGAFANALHAVENARAEKLITALSVCVTREFVTEKNLARYASLAKDCGVSFVQLLEPKPVGHYEAKNVSLTKEQIALLDKFYIEINFNKQYDEYPLFIYHGYYQRKIGCMSAGNWGLYIDSAGFINACTFCHTKNHHARDLISGELKIDQIQVGQCPAFVN